MERVHCKEVLYGSAQLTWFREPVDGLLTQGAPHVPVNPLVEVPPQPEIVLQDVKTAHHLREYQHLQWSHDSHTTVTRLIANQSNDSNGNMIISLAPPMTTPTLCPLSFSLARSLSMSTILPEAWMRAFERGWPACRAWKSSTICSSAPVYEVMGDYSTMVPSNRPCMR